MEITVVLATRNSERTIGETLEAMTHLEYPLDRWALIVVDSGSTDRTVDIVSSFRHRMPIRLYQHPERGKYACLNRVVQHFQGDLVVITDDDVVVPGNWLLEWSTVAASRPDHHLFGGRITPRWSEPPAEWLLEEADATVVWAATPEEWQEGPCAPGRVRSPNMAIRRGVFERGLRFDERFGTPDAPAGGETDFIRRATDLGFRCWYAPSTSVERVVGPDAVEPRQVVRRAVPAGREMGLAEARRLRAAGPPRHPEFIGLPRWRIRLYFVALLRAWFHRVRRRDREWFREAWKAAFERGILSEIRHARAAPELPEPPTSRSATPPASTRPVVRPAPPRPARERTPEQSDLARTT